MNQQQGNNYQQQQPIAPRAPLNEDFQKQIQQDWANREYIEVISGSIKRIADFLNSFDLSCRYRLTQLNEKLTSLERKIEVLEAWMDKRKNMFLDLNSPKRSKKIELLSSPDVQKFKLASPDVENFIKNPNTSLVTPTQVFFPKNVTAEQELYAKGFVDALAQLQENSSSNNSEDNNSSDYHDYNQSNNAITIKLDPDQQIVPMQQIDMESQEKIKLERKRQRNRIAASKCRKRKLERISKLEDKVKALKNENENLNSVLSKIKDNVNSLKGKIQTHLNSGCQIMVSNNNKFS